MAEHSSIEWTDATWNPVTGCSVISPGCTNCYAMRLAGTRLQNHPSRAGLTRDTKAGPVWTGELRLNEGWLTQPLQWRRPRRIFVCAHGDLFHEGVPDAWLDRVFAVMALAPHHTYQVLTKRAARMRAYIEAKRHQAPEWVELPTAHARVLLPYEGGWPRYIWLGVSAEDQRRADERIPDLLATPAAVRFVSAEPLLGPLDLVRWLAINWRCSYCREFFTGRHRAFCPSCGRVGGWTGSHAFNGRHQPKRPGWPIDRGSGLDWIIVGGESGPGARPMHPDWARSLRDQCASAGVPFHFKQHGAWAPVEEPASEIQEDEDLRGIGAMLDGQYMRRVGRIAAGRQLDGALHDGMPGVAA